MTEQEELVRIRAENAQLRKITRPGRAGRGQDKTGLYIGGVLALSTVAVLAIMGIFAIRPDKDNSGLITVVIGFLFPSVTALLGAALHEVHLAVNGRLSELLALTAKSSKAEGVAQEQIRG